MVVRVIIAGSRQFSDYELLKNEVDKFLEGVEGPIEILEGGAKGADALGNKYGHEKGFPVTTFTANWNKYGKSAGPRRNRELAEAGTYLIAFWDGSSRGTANMIEEARKRNLITEIVYYENEL